MREEDGGYFGKRFENYRILRISRALFDILLFSFLSFTNVVTYFQNSKLIQTRLLYKKTKTKKNLISLLFFHVVSRNAYF